MKITTSLTIAFVVLAMAIYIPSPHPEAQIQKASISTLTYPNSDVSVLWVRRNGSDPGFPYSGSNVSPSYGMNYFGTNILQVTYSYNWTDIANPSLFPANTELYIQIGDDSTPSDAISIADQALTDSRIKGAYIDDFRLGWQNASNMSAIYTGIHHNDGVLGYNLTLGLVVYNRNYYQQSPNSWSSIEPYFDIIHFWFYPNSYSLLYSQFAGYEDAFMEMHSWMPTKEYWLGIYLHYYNVAIYPFSYSYEQMSIASKLIKKGFATRLSILENFWIQHNPTTSVIVRNFVNNELQMNYTSVWNAATGSVVSYQAGIPLVSSLLTSVQTSWARNYTFTSTHLQTVIVTNLSGADYIIQNTRNGGHTNATIIGSNISIVLEPGESYKLYSQPMAYYSISSRTYIEASTSWNFRHVTLNNVLNINKTLWVNNSIIQISDHMHKNSMYNATTPDYGIIFNLTNTAKLYLNNCTIEPKLKAFPYYFNTTWSNSAGQSRVISIRNSTLSCYAGSIFPLGYTNIADSTFFQAQPNGASHFASIWLLAGGSTYEFFLRRTLVWNYETAGSVGIFMLPTELWMYGALKVDDCRIAGAEFGLWVDMGWSSPGTEIRFTNLQSYPTDSPSSLFSNYWIQGTTDKLVSIESNILEWSLIELGTGPTVTFITTNLSSNMAYKAFKNGISIAQQTGPIFTFTGSGGGDYAILAVYTKQVYGLIQLIFIIFAVGVVVGVIAEGTHSLRRKEMLTTEQMMKMLVNMVIYIIIGLAGIGILYSTVA